MRSVRPKAFLIVLWVLATLVVTSVVSAEEKPWTEQFLNEFIGIKTRLVTVEKTQQDILAQKDQILEKLDQLRIWVHRNGTKPQGKAK